MDSIAERYERDGYCFPIRVVDASQAQHYRMCLEAADRDFGSDPARRKLMVGNAQFVLPFVDEIMRLPAMIRSVIEVLGPNLLVIGAAFFVKEARSPKFVSWHQDLTYWGLSDSAEVTAWLALSPSTSASGCMQFVPESHKLEIVQHRDTFAAGNMLSRGQELAIDVPESEAVEVVLQPGEMSLHHGHMFHSSGPNQSSDDRIGLAIRYAAPHMRLTSGLKTFAHLVAGEDIHGNFRVAHPAQEVMDDADVAIALESVAIQESVRYAGAVDLGKRLS